MAISQANRPIRVTLGDVPTDGVLLTGIKGTEALSRLYSFTIDVVAPVDAPIAFKDALGKPVLVEVDQADGQTRFFHGFVNRFSQGRKDNKFVSYRAEVVPKLWLLTKQIRSRVFQPIVVKDLLTAVIGGLFSPRLKELKGEYFTRNHTVQYRESDFDFISRLMEEEGIYYYFTHTKDGQELVIADNARGHDEVPAEMPLRFQDDGLANPAEGRITSWEKVQELRFGAVDYSDHHFEMPTNDLKAIMFPLDKVKVGTVEHDFKLGEMDKVGLVDHPGGYAHFRDAINPGGADQSDDLEHLFEDNARLASVRMDQEQVKALQIEGTSTFTRLTAGHKFTLADHFDADGDYVITSVSHNASCGVGDSGDPVDFKYSNQFTCIPFDIPFRPARTTPKPFVQGTQTAVVVGGGDEEIDPDKFGRVKVLFRWDPEGNRALDSSCWVRVAQFWAGKQWGAQFIPRVGDEVVVAFEHGDPDQPIIIGSVYNADNMPIYTLPKNKTQSGIKTHSSKGGTTETFNELKFEDKKGQELISVHAERNMSTSVEVDNSTSVGNNNSVSIGTNPKGDPHKVGKSSTTIFGDTSFTVTDGDYAFNIAKGKADFSVKKDVTEIYDAKQTTTVKKDQMTHITEGHHLVKVDTGHASLHVDTGNRFVVVGAGFYDLIAATKITLKCGASSLTLEKDGKITLKGVKILIDGGETSTMQAPEASVSGTKKASLGVSAQSVVCDTSKTAVSGAQIKAAASGTHDITGALVKIN